MGPPRRYAHAGFHSMPVCRKNRSKSDRSIVTVTGRFEPLHEVVARDLVKLSAMERRASRR